MTESTPIWKQLLVSLAVLAAVAGLWLERDQLASAIGWQPSSAAVKEIGVAKGVPVIVTEAAVASDDLTFQAVGTGRALRSIMLRMETEGKVAEINLGSGKRFSSGDVLLRLDDRDQRLAVQLAETRLAEAERIRERYIRLQDTGAAAAVRLDEVSTAAEIAAIELERAAEALEKRALIAPFDGVSGLPDVEEGDWIDNSVEIASYDDRSAILVEFDLPEALLSRIRDGLPVSVETPAFAGRTFEGTISAIDSRVDSASRTATVRVIVPNDEDLLRPGASFTVKLALPGERYPIVPELAVQFSRGSLHVWRVRNEKAERVEVELVRRRDGKVLVDGPLTEGDLIVVEGTQRLAPGKPVVLIGQPSQGAAS